MPWCCSEIRRSAYGAGRIPVSRWQSPSWAAPSRPKPTLRTVVRHPSALIRGGPYEMSIVGKNSLKLSDILIGDVWLASGQSNMELQLKSSFGLTVDNADREVAAASFPQIRLLRVQQKTAPRPDSDTTSEGWHAVTPETAANFSAVAYFFGRELHQRYHVPIGLIQAAWGGTVAEAWMSESALQRFPSSRSRRRRCGESPKGRGPIIGICAAKKEWYRAHAQDDRGRVDGRNIWADPKFDSIAWPTIALPQDFQLAARISMDSPGRSGIGEHLRCPRSSLASPCSSAWDSWPRRRDLFQWTAGGGDAEHSSNSREYVVPAKHVRAGENSIVVRLTGINVPTFACTGSVRSGRTDDGDHRHGRSSRSRRLEFMPGPDLQDFPRADAATLAANPSPNAPTTLFNGMINPLRPMRIKGVIWYQGESNASRPAQYRTLFPALISDWRKQWGDDLPFLFVQLAGYGPNPPEPADYPLAELREAQTMTLSVPATGMASAIDIGNEHDIHPSNKQEVGHRLALAAAKVAYGENIVDSGPHLPIHEDRESADPNPVLQCGFGPLDSGQIRLWTRLRDCRSRWKISLGSGATGRTRHHRLEPAGRASHRGALCVEQHTRRQCL